MARLRLYYNEMMLPGEETMEKIWLKSYQTGVPAEIDVNEFRSIGDLFEKSVKLYGPRKAYINMDKSITYAELEKLSAAFGAYCQSVLKLPKGSRIALMMPNLLQYPICLYGALRAGYTVVNCNPLYTEPVSYTHLTLPTKRIV